jgi:hypothetical protein
MAKIFIPALSPLLVDFDGEVAALAFDVLNSLISEIKKLVPPPPNIRSYGQNPSVATSVASAPTITSGMYLTSNLSNSPPEKFWNELSKPAVAQATKINFDSFWDDISKPASNSQSNQNPPTTSLI